MIEEAVRRAVAGAINRSLDQIHRDSQKEVPLDEGTLLRSGSVEDATPANLEGRVVYDTPYAAAQHEGMAGVHPVQQYSQPGRKAKYLEDPLKANLNDTRRLIEKAAAKAAHLAARDLAK